MTAHSTDFYLNQNDVKNFNDMLRTLPDLISRERALVAAERKAARVFSNILDRYTGSPGLFRNVDTQSSPAKGRSYINNLNSTIHIATIRGRSGSAPGVRVGLKARKGRYVSYHGNFLEGGTVMRSKGSGSSTGKISRSYGLMEKVWREGIGQAKSTLYSELPKIIDRAYKKAYKGR